MQKFIMHYMDIVSESKGAVQINISLFEFSKSNTRKWCELCSELTIKTLEHSLHKK